MSRSKRNYDHLIDDGGNYKESLENTISQRGDLLVGGTDGGPSRLAVGVTNQVLTAAGGDVIWGENKDKDTNIEDLSIHDLLVYRDEDPGLVDPDGAAGWYYENVTSNNKINWYFYVQGVGADHITLEKIQSMGMNIRAKDDNTVLPYFTVYTKRKNDGRDHALSYRSRVSFVPFNYGSLSKDDNYVVYVRQNPTYFPQYDHIESTVDYLSTVGPHEQDEVIKEIAISTQTGFLPLAYKFTVQQAVIVTDDFDHIFSFNSSNINLKEILSVLNVPSFADVSAVTINDLPPGSIYYDLALAKLSIFQP